jgi:hypothetical protein
VIDLQWTIFAIAAVAGVLAVIVFAVWRLEKGIEAKEVLLRKVRRIKTVFKGNRRR